MTSRPREVGATDTTRSGSTTTLIGRRGKGWLPIAPADADDAWLYDAPRERYGPNILGEIVPTTGAPPYAEPGDELAIHAGSAIEMSRVVRDDRRGLVLRLPSGSARLTAQRSDGAGIRDVPMHRRFSGDWVMREGVWRGHGVLRVAPHAVPWSVWWFWNDDATFAGWYVNFELPHRRSTDPHLCCARSHTRDLTLDLWLNTDSQGEVEVWLKDADELQATVDQGRYTREQASGIQAAADRFCREVIEPWAWPLSEAWQDWRPPVELDVPVPLPDDALTQALRTHRRTL